MRNWLLALWRTSATSRISSGAALNFNFLDIIQFLGLDARLKPGRVSQAGARRFSAHGLARFSHFPTLLVFARSRPVLVGYPACDRESGRTIVRPLYSPANAEASGARSRPHSARIARSPLLGGGRMRCCVAPIPRYPI